MIACGGFLWVCLLVVTLVWFSDCICFNTVLGFVLDCVDY